LGEENKEGKRRKEEKASAKYAISMSLSVFI
jgi:hypothetical protein